MTLLTQYAPTAEQIALSVLTFLGALYVFASTLGRLLPGKAGALCVALALDVAKVLAVFGKPLPPATEPAATPTAEPAAQPADKEPKP